MIHKYLTLLQQVFGSFRHLGRESNWTDYFHTIGLEFLILLIGIIAIATLIIIFVVPYIGTVKINKWFDHKNHLKDIKGFMWEYKNSICAVLDQLWTIKQVKHSQDSQYGKSICKKLNNSKQVLSDIGLLNYDSELREQLNSFIKYVESTHIQLDAEVVSDEEQKVSDMAQKLGVREQLDNFNTYMKTYVESIRTRFTEEKQKVSDMAQELVEDISKYCIKWSSADLKNMEEFNNSTLTHAINTCLKEKLNIDIDIKDVIKHKFRMQAEQYIALGLFYVIYAIFVVPLVMMLF